MEITYHVGDYVFFQEENSPNYSIKKIKSIYQDQSNETYIKAITFYRRKDLPDHQIFIANKSLCDVFFLDKNPELKWKIMSKELFISHSEQSYPLVKLRGKCNVINYQESKDTNRIIKEADTFFYTLIYNTSTKKLQNVRSFVRIGDQYQASVCGIPCHIGDVTESPRERLVWTPEHDENYNNYMDSILSLAILSRRLNEKYAEYDIDLLTSAGLRDVTIEIAHDLLHSSDYNIDEAVVAFSNLLNTEKILDEYEKWSFEEAEIFEESLIKYSKNFSVMQLATFPTKSMKELVSFYYFWKTNSVYVEHQALKRRQREGISLENVIYIHREETKEGFDSTTKACLFCDKGPVKVAGNLWDIKTCWECYMFWIKHAHFPISLGELRLRVLKKPLDLPPDYDPVDEEILKDLVLGQEPSPRSVHLEKNAESRNCFMLLVKNPMKLARRWALQGQIRRISRNPTLSDHSLNVNLDDWENYYRKHTRNLHVKLGPGGDLPMRSLRKKMPKPLKKNQKSPEEFKKSPRKLFRSKKLEISSSIQIYSPDEDERKQRNGIDHALMRRMARRPVNK